MYDNGRGLGEMLYILYTSFFKMSILSEQFMCFFRRLFCAARHFLPFLSSDLVDVSLKVSVLEELCNDVLLKGGNGAGIKAKARVKLSHKLPRQDHVADTKGRGDGFGKGVQIDHVVPIRKSEQRILGLRGDRKFRFKIVLDDIPVVCV